jgi:hypothetical protein
MTRSQIAFALGLENGERNVRQTARAVLDDDEHVQHPKRRRDGDEEVAGEDGPCMTLQEGRPALVAAGSPGRSLGQVLAHGSWRDPNSRLEQQFVGDALFAPQHVFPGHPADQFAQFHGDRRPTGPGLHSPEEINKFCMSRWLFRLT